MITEINLRITVSARRKKFRTCVKIHQKLYGGASIIPRVYRFKALIERFLGFKDYTIFRPSFQLKDLIAGTSGHSLPSKPDHFVTQLFCYALQKRFRPIIMLNFPPIRTKIGTP